MSGVFLFLFGCSALEPRPSEPAPAAPVVVPKQAPRPYWVERSDAELDELIDAACQTATAEGQPMLLAFSAPWCGDCQKVRSLEQSSPLREELLNWTKVVVHVGRFDRHPSLLESFGVNSVAHWVALRPDCSLPVTGWKRLRSSVFEPVSNPEGVRTSAELAAWLAEARARSGGE